VHIAIAAVNGMDYILTWNCAHLASAAARGTIERTCRAAACDPLVRYLQGRSPARLREALGGPGSREQSAKGAHDRDLYRKGSRWV
jgi:hypothetical protein